MSWYKEVHSKLLNPDHNVTTIIPAGTGTSFDVLSYYKRQAFLKRKNGLEITFPTTLELLGEESGTVLELYLAENAPTQRLLDDDCFSFIAWVKNKVPDGEMFSQLALYEWDKEHMSRLYAHPDEFSFELTQLGEETHFLLLPYSTHFYSYPVAEISKTKQKCPMKEQTIILYLRPDGLYTKVLKDFERGWIEELSRGKKLGELELDNQDPEEVQRFFAWFGRSLVFKLR